MSVTESGQAGYEYQYAGSVYFILSLIYVKKIDTAYIEKLNSEDLTIRLVNSSIVEFQFKLKDSAFGIDSLASCCLNFDNRSKSENVLSKIESGIIDSFYIVTSARAKDDVSNLKVLLSSDFTPKKSSGEIKASHYKLFLQNLKATFKNETKTLGKERYSFVTAQVSRIESHRNVHELLDKIHVIELVDRQFFIDKSRELLNKLNIPSDLHQSVLNQLDTVIRSNRINNQNIVDNFKCIINANIANIPRINKYYKVRGSETQLVKDLEKNKMIFLTGESFAGKTQTAIYVSTKFCEKFPGTTFIIVSTFVEAQNFLLSESNEKRLCILEDPFGQGNDSYHLSYQKLEELKMHIESRYGRFLVVTSNLASLNQVTSMDVIKSMWVDLTVNDKIFLNKLWSELSKNVQNGVLIKKVFNLLDKMEEDWEFQPGHLSSIANLGPSLKVIDDSTIKSLAFTDATTIKSKVIDMGNNVVNLMVLFAITTSTRNGPTIEDLKYLLSNKEDFPGLLGESKLRIKRLLKLNDEIPEFPKYKKYEELNSTYYTALEELINCEFIKDEDGVFFFSHPMYEVAAKLLLASSFESSIKKSRIFEWIKKGIAALNSTVSENSINVLFVLLQKIREGGKINNDLIPIADFALKSTFVNVRFEAFQFLILNRNDLIDEVRMNLEKIISSGIANSFEIQWFKGAPYIPDYSKGQNGIGMSRRISERLEGDEIWLNYQQCRTPLNPRDAYLLIDYLYDKTRKQKSRISLAIELLLPFIRYKEFFIVEKSAYLIAASITDDNFNNYSYLFAEDRPYIKFEFLKGLMRSWPYLIDVDNRNLSYQKMISYLDDEYVSLVALDFFTQFDAGHTRFTFDWRDEIEETVIVEMWNLWAKLCSKVFLKLPRVIHIHNARFHATLSQEFVSDINALDILSHSFLFWVTHHLKGNTNYITEIADSILSFWKLHIFQFSEASRTILINSVLEIENILFFQKFIVVLVQSWGSFNEEEKITIELKFQNFSVHQKAIVLTTINCPDVFFLKWLGFNKSTFSSKQDNLEELKSNELVKMCLVMNFYYRPFYGFNANNDFFWLPLLIFFISEDDSDMQLLSVYTYLRSKFVFNNKEPNEWPSCDFLSELFLNRFTNKVKLDVCMMIVYYLNYDHHFSRLFLLELFNKFNNENLTLFGNVVYDFLELIVDSDNMDVFPSKFLDDYILPKLVSERIVLNIIEANDIGQQSIDIIVRSIENKTLKHRNVLEKIKSFLVDNSVDEPIVTLVEKYEEEISEKASNQLDKIDRKIHDSFLRWLPENM